MERLTSAFERPVPARILKELDSLPDVVIGELLPNDLVSGASCLGVTRKEGGRASLLTAAKVRDVRSNPNSGLNRVLLNSHYRSMKTVATPAHAESIFIPEQGAKYRLVTKNDPATVAHSHRARRALFPLLSAQKHVSTSASLLDPELARLDIKPYKGGRIFSADLTAATDLMGRPVISALCSRYGIPLSWVCSDTLDGVTVVRGTSMGLPASWPVLSLVHYAIARIVDPGHNFWIKGDDLIAFWSDFHIRLYRAMLDSVGFSLNEKKSVISDTLGVFCEVTYERKGNSLVRLRDFSLRGFCRGEPLPPDQWQMLVRHGATLKRLNFLTRKSCREYLRLSRRFGVDPYGPPAIGGLGMPPKAMSAKLTPRSSALIRAAHNGSFTVMDPESCSGPMVSRVRKAMFDTISWGVEGKGSVDAFDELSSLMTARAAFVDAAHGRLKSGRFRRVQKMRRLVECAKLNAGKAQPFPTTYATAYDVLHRLRPMENPRVPTGVRPSKTISSIYDRL
nr:RNA-dependent RNA polymerase [Ustilaginoidea virens narnavirus virus 13]